MKYFIDAVIVVEGKEDICYLSSFIESEYVSLGGNNIPKEEIDYLNEVSKFKKIIVLSDPDKAGQIIKNRLKELLPQAIYLDIDIAKCNRGKKTGVAECESQEIIEVLKPYFSEKNPQKSTVLQEKLSKITFSDKGLREYLSNKYHLGKVNTKKLFIRLESLQISVREIEKSIEEYQSGN